MTLATWLAVVSICALGAMSPGPSLAVVLRQSLSGGRRNGSIAAVTHAAGIGVYALLSISGLAVLITASPELYGAFQWAGAAYLAWLGVRGLAARGGTLAEGSDRPSTASAAREGFLIVFLNPKVAVFFIALFSQVIGADTSLAARLGYAATAFVIDLLWYLLVAWVFSSPRWLPALRARAIWFERLFGAILLALAARLVVENLL
ncbi:MAG: LysE family transporter [Xanthomonadales bacterium]|nr:LysE family transporter [Xanthomonadales bacterium]NIN59245.1 LysE family transporter [Xanthomonadales bacterium]NIN74596.1 LysE family transporter [Xanthomonadales bacterium]NIO12543.1 LysE family transporter [Xanthomonadales bacterium]NIP11638.1 LysE family transporter [Xanthomonadales bacterium]